MLPARVENTLTWCGGAELREFFAGGSAALEHCAAAIDRLNVFPVPDGDTGTNLTRTLADALRAVGADSSEDVGVVAQRLAAAALQHARGNSGTIFAQLCAGLAQSLAGSARADVHAWANAWEHAATTARHSVNAPVEGTILTVAADAAAAARAASAATKDLIAVWRAMADAGDATVAKTPQMLAILEEASVVDAGALGLALFLRGATAAFTGEALPDPATLMQPSNATRRVIETASFPRFCTQFLLHAISGEPADLTARLATFGDSLDIVRPSDAESARVLRVHVHTDDPDAVVAYASTIGSVSGLKVDDMQRQRAMLLSTDGELEGIAIVAVAPGNGMRKLFESLYGVAAVVAHRDELDAAIAEVVRRSSDAADQHILVLANDPRAGDLADVGAVLARKPIIVLTRNAPEGVAAALAFNSDLSAEENARAMAEAVQRLTTVCVSIDARTNGRVVAVSNGQTAATGSDLVDTAEAALCSLCSDVEVAGLVTLYHGVGATRAHADALATRIRERFPNLETEIIAGGQPECSLWIAVETDAGSNRH